MPLDEFVLKYSPIERTEFKQAEWLAKVNDLESGGRCFAFALAYLLVVSRGAPGKHLLETLNIAADKQDTNVIKEITAQSKESQGTDKWVGTDLFTLQVSNKLRDRVLASFGLEVDDEVRFMHKNRKFDDLADYVATADTTLSLLMVPNHALAVASRPACENIWSFFDPNLGEATFRTAEDLHECVANFFAHKKVKGAYKRKQVAELARGETLQRQKLEVLKMTVDVLRCRPRMQS